MIIVAVVRATSSPSPKEWRLRKSSRASGDRSSVDLRKTDKSILAGEGRAQGATPARRQRNPRSLVLPGSPAYAEHQLGLQRFGVPEIHGIEAFDQLIVNRLYQPQSFSTATLVLPKTSQITGRAQLPGARLLMPSDLQAVDEQSLDLLGRSAGGLEEAGLDAQDFGDGP
jgi:hypothetical protein